MYSSKHNNPSPDSAAANSAWKTGGNGGWYSGSDSEYGYGRIADARAALATLLIRLQDYDLLRRKLERDGGRVNDLAQIANLLTRKIELKGPYGTGEASLAEPSAMRALIADVAGYDVRFQVRRRDHGRLPLYYVCRTRQDYWSEHSLIVEDLHKSPGYPMPDQRFVRLMAGGHESYFLRLSPFRSAVEEMLAARTESDPVSSVRTDETDPTAGHEPENRKRNGWEEDDDREKNVVREKKGWKGKEGREKPESRAGSARDRKTESGWDNGHDRTGGSARRSWVSAAGRKGSGAVDDLLYRVGRHALQAAWHEDQHLGILAATHLGLDNFRQAIELLYLTLSGDLCELRGAATDDMRTFFETVYPQPAIHALLNRLSHIDGDALNELPRNALKLYARLSRAFGEFLAVETTWGHRRARLPLYQILFANVQRFDTVAPSLLKDTGVMLAAKRLEEEARKIIETMIPAA